VPLNLSEREYFQPGILYFGTKNENIGVTAPYVIDVDTILLAEMKNIKFKWRQHVIEYIKTKRITVVNLVNRCKLPTVPS